MLRILLTPQILIDEFQVVLPNIMERPADSFDILGGRVAGRGVEALEGWTDGCGLDGLEDMGLGVIVRLVQTSFFCFCGSGILEGSS